jgi:hypothetical protein
MPIGCNKSYAAKLAYAVVHPSVLKAFDRRDEH